MKNRSSVVGLLVLFLGSTAVVADDPLLRQLSPPGFTRGTESEVVLTGNRLGDVRELLMYQTGIEVTKLEADGENSVKAVIRIPEDCPPGLHAVRIATETGISNLRYFGVSALPQIEEVEPNSDFAEPQAIELNTTVNGVVQNEDVDYFALDLKEGQVVTIELEGLRLGTEFFDPFVAILDADRFEMVSSDDATLVQQDCICSLKAPKTGRYVIEVRESSFGGNDRSQYRLHVGDFPRPLAVIPSGGRPGETIEAKLVDASGEVWTEQIELPSEPGDYDYIASRDGKFAPSPNRLRVVDLPNVLESEPDIDREAITAVDAPVAFNGVLQEEGDIDWFKIRAKKDQQLVFNVYGRRVLRSPIDSWLEIHKASGGRLAANDDSGGPDSSQAFKFPEDGEYLIAIRDQLNEGSPLFAYRIEVSPGERSLALSIDELQRYLSQTVEVPQGQQMAVLLRAKRNGFGGDLGLHLESAPAGLELITPTIAANQSYIPMMIKAAPDAPVDAALAELVAETPPDGPGVKGGLEQRTMLVRGQNNRDMWGHEARRLAIAVTKELPFSIEVEQPRVPLCRNGSSHYVVKANRKEGFTEAIALRLLYNPPGCSASGSVRIDGDKDEAHIPVTANGNAAIGSHPITVLARAKSSNGNVWVASEFINLQVVDSFFDYKFTKTVAETGGKTEVIVGLDVKQPPEGETRFELVGLPAGVTSPNPIVKLEGELSRLAFPIEVAADARVGQFKTLVVKATITRPDGTILQTQGTGELQLAAPVVSQQVAAKQPAASSAPTEKPLSRLEQLRQAKQLLQDAQN